MHKVPEKWAEGVGKHLEREGEGWGKTGGRSGAPGVPQMCGEQAPVHQWWEG